MRHRPDFFPGLLPDQKLFIDAHKDEGADAADSKLSARSQSLPPPLPPRRYLLDSHGVQSAPVVQVAAQTASLRQTTTGVPTYERYVQQGSSTSFDFPKESQMSPMSVVSSSSSISGERSTAASPSASSSRWENYISPDSDNLGHQVGSKLAELSVFTKAGIKLYEENLSRGAIIKKVRKRLSPFVPDSWSPS